MEYISNTNTIIISPEFDEELTNKHIEIISKYNRRVDQDSSLDQLYDEIQVPLLICILYFLFQLPIFKKQLFHYLPFLFNKDGNINLNGLAFVSVMFGGSYYFCKKIMQQLNKI